MAIDNMNEKKTEEQPTEQQKQQVDTTGDTSTPLALGWIVAVIGIFAFIIAIFSGIRGDLVPYVIQIVCGGICLVLGLNLRRRTKKERGGCLVATSILLLLLPLLLMAAILIALAHAPHM